MAAIRRLLLRPPTLTSPQRPPRRRSRYDRCADPSSLAIARTDRTTDAGAEARVTIGPYRLLQCVGEGGVGQVWRAEQTAPVRRTVTLKVLKTGMDTVHVTARFEAERQALVVMDHPAIVKLFDAGATPEWRPFSVMEYVPGGRHLRAANLFRPALVQGITKIF
jgi:serine/threonine protein kinase